jgi:glycine cleavage system H protein
MFYNIDHEWINFNPKTLIGTVGITDYAQSVLGDVTLIQMPEVGSKFKQGDVLGKLESKQVVDDIYCPLSGEIVEVNKRVIENPKNIDPNPDAEGWLVRIKIQDFSELTFLYDKQGYEKLVQMLKKKIRT